MACSVQGARWLVIGRLVVSKLVIGRLVIGMLAIGGLVIGMHVVGGLDIGRLAISGKSATGGSDSHATVRLAGMSARRRQSGQAGMQLPRRPSVRCRWQGSRRRESRVIMAPPWVGAGSMAAQHHERRQPARIRCRKSSSDDTLSVVPAPHSRPRALLLTKQWGALPLPAPAAQRVKAGRGGHHEVRAAVKVLHTVIVMRHGNE